MLFSFKGLDSLESGSPPGPPNALPNSPPQRPPYTANNNNDVTVSDSTALQIIENRKGPEGKDDDSLLENHMMDSNSSTKENSYTTDVNGKVTVHVVVTINGNGTLADLKKQRMQIRNNSSEANSMTSPLGSISDESNVSPTAAEIVRFTGETTEENVGYAKSKRCCIVQ